MKKQILIVSLAVLAVCLIGCDQNSGIDLSNTTVIGQVTAIDGSLITLQLGELIENNGETDQAAGISATTSTKTTSGKTATSTTPSEQTSTSVTSLDQVAPNSTSQNGTSTGNRLPSEAPAGEGGTMMTFIAGDNSVTITIGDDASITVEGNSGNLDGTVDDIAMDDVLEVTLGDDSTVTAVTVKNVMSSSSTEVENGTSANTIDEDTTVADSIFTSTGDDENALRVDGAQVTLNGITINKTDGASSSTENGDFYGMNAGLLALNSAQVTIVDAIINTSAVNGNGVFSYGEGTMVNISNSSITTTANNSGGIQTTGGGTTKCTSLNVSTAGNSSAAIRSDRGGGTVFVDGGSYETLGTGSPAIYSTADITVSNSTLSATNSEAIVVEGLNSIALKDCDLTGNMTGTYNGNDTENIHNIMLYQSMSGDAKIGTSQFSATGGTITAYAGDMFYITNTSSVIDLNDVILNLANGTLLTVAGNSSSRGWGTAGQNGGNVEFTATDMTLAGAVTVDTISTLNFTLANGATFNGAINIVNNEACGTAVANNAVVTVDKGAVWNLSGACTITTLTNNGTINYNGYTITLADGTVLNG